MEAPRGHPSFRACAEARLRASLALDGGLDEVGRLHLRVHLEGCSDCVRVMAGMESASGALRREPLERFRCEILPGQLVRARSSGHGRHLAGAAVAVAALVLATGALPGRDDTAAESPPAAGVAPLELPIGQRSAMDDFAAPAGS